MEQVIATINYFIREKLWCSIRKLCDLVSNTLAFRLAKSETSSEGWWLASAEKNTKIEIPNDHDLCRKWRRELTRYWFSGRPSASSRRAAWRRPSVNSPGYRNAEKYSLQQQLPWYTIMRGAGTLTRRLSTLWQLHLMRRSQWLLTATF